MAKVIKILVLLFFICGAGQIAYGAKKNPKAISQKNFKKLKSTLNKQSRILKKLAKEISSLDSSLGKNNKKYISIIEDRKKLELEVDLLKSQIQEQKSSLNAQYAKINTTLNGVVLGSLDDDGVANLLSNKILVTSLKKKLFKLKLSLEQNKKQESELDSMYEEYHKFINYEKQLADIITKLENEKREVALNYKSARKKKDILKVSYDKAKAKRYLKRNKKIAAVAKDLGMKFGIPIDSYTGFNSKKKKGVSLSFRKVQPVIAPASGKIVLNSNVGSFGKILFIDHGNNIRSVILGNYSPKVEKGTMVSKGDVLGYTDKLGNKIGEIYYEVRKKDKALNTIGLLDKKIIK